MKEGTGDGLIRTYKSLDHPSFDVRGVLKLVEIPIPPLTLPPVLLLGSGWRSRAGGWGRRLGEGWGWGGGRDEEGVGGSARVGFGDAEV